MSLAQYTVHSSKRYVGIEAVTYQSRSSQIYIKYAQQSDAKLSKILRFVIRHFIH
jgi:hypothetical protein